jgi:hypothetical protein
MKHYYYQLCNMHKGEIIEKAVRMSGIPISKLAKKLNRSRQWLYRVFESEQVSIDSVLEIGKAIHHDFTDEFGMIKGADVYLKNESNNMLEEESAEYWKIKYIHLLEEYNRVLKKQ